MYCLIGPNDVTTSPFIRPLRAIPLSFISLTYRLDGLSQEFNETFLLELDLDVDDSNFFPDSSEFSDITIGRLNGTIIDQDGELKD
jgi:hypothetical protein